MKTKPFLFVILFVFLFLETAFSGTKFQITPQNVEEWKRKCKSEVPKNFFAVVSHADFVDWKSLQPADYDEIYARISEEFFLSQFSLKRGFQLEPFFPVLFPKTPEVLQNMEPKVREKLAQIQRDVNLTLHEIHNEFFLLPLTTWCVENQVALKYEIGTEPYIPVRFLIEDACLVRNVYAEKDDGLAYALATSMARLNGRLNLENTRIDYTKQRIVLLIPDLVSCDELNFAAGEYDFLSESQIPYATVRLEKNGPVAGWGAAAWKTIQLLQKQEKYLPETQNFLKHFEEFEGKILKK